MVTVGLKWDKRDSKLMQLQLYYHYIHILCTNSSYYYCYCWFWLLLLLLVRWELEIPTKFCYIYERVVAVGKRYGFLIRAPKCSLGAL